MSAGGTEQARAVARRLLAACLPSAGAAAPAPPVAGSVRCWTPLRDWEQGSSGLASLRQIMAAYCARLPSGAEFSPSALITDGSLVVVEAATAGTGREAVNVTLVLVLNSDLVEEVRCYTDPRALDAAAAPPEGGLGGASSP